ncbi:hypothetical protein EPO66_01530 [bacterium]|nr:MAG: hypothetical protein EPO66_01530 [bacterium]
MIDYHERNASHFADNKDVPYSCGGDNNLIKTRKTYKELYKIAMVQADVLGYSMGGLLARIWANTGDYSYLRNNNYWQGDYNKLITLDTPHYGSFLAEAGVRCVSSAHSKLMDRILKEMDKHGQFLTKGAVADLMVSSDAIKDMNKSKTFVLCHAILGNYSEAYLTANVTPNGTKWVIEGLPYTENLGFGVEFSPYAILNALLDEGYGYIINLAMNIGTDLVADTVSQSGGLDSAYASVYDHHHMAVTYNVVLWRVIELLNASADAGLFADKFPEN